MLTINSLDECVVCVSKPASPYFTGFWLHIDILTLPPLPHEAYFSFKKNLLAVMKSVKTVLMVVNSLMTTW